MELTDNKTSLAESPRNYVQENDMIDNLHIVSISLPL